MTKPTPTVRFKMGWRWVLAERAVPVLARVGLPARACVWLLNVALRGVRISVGDTGTWAPVEGVEITLEPRE